MSKAKRALQRLVAREKLDPTAAAEGLRELYASGLTDTELETLLIEHVDHDTLATIVSELHAEAEREEEADRDASAELQAQEQQAMQVVRFEEMEADAERVRYRLHFFDREPAEVVLIRDGDQAHLETEPGLRARVVEREVEVQTMQSLEKRLRQRIEITYAGGTYYVDVAEW